MNHLERQSRKRCLDLASTLSVAAWIDSSPNLDMDEIEEIFHLKLRCNSRSLPLPFSTFCTAENDKREREKKKRNEKKSIIYGFEDSHKFRNGIICLAPGDGYKNFIFPHIKCQR